MASLEVEPQDIGAGLDEPSPYRIFAVFDALRAGTDIAEISARTDMPGRSTACSVTASGMWMRTGRRCTILVKLPDPGSNGSRVNSLPDPGARLSTVPASVCPSAST